VHVSLTVAASRVSRTQCEFAGEHVDEFGHDDVLFGVGFAQFAVGGVRCVCFGFECGGGGGAGMGVGDSGLYCEEEGGE